MFSFLRGVTPARRHTANISTITYENDTSSQTFHGNKAPYFVTHTIPNKKSFLNPPTHLHLFQTEDFLVEKGTGIFYQPTASNPAHRKVVKTAGDPPVHLPMGTYHRFENASDSEELVVKLRIDPPGSNAVNEEQFFRNFLGYLEDCRIHGSEPSIFQLELFLYTVDVSLAIPCPGSDGVKWWVSRIVMFILGVVIGEWMLGYKRTYPEYYSGKNTGC
ncbi:hypothetical protein HYFRA_00010945 [Hymenoscyphus fraxineus]|uniref:Uncharacterized protein n=1 Tax=Hymenoscyphus fraxineus TaxID=746836 RepID=A0A9N9L0W9_9HELO|nr:hypothetical protein HYFRA_00010945 [Hymenoscyphus fraxineus]